MTAPAAPAAPDPYAGQATYPGSMCLRCGIDAGSIHAHLVHASLCSNGDVQRFVACHSCATDNWKRTTCRACGSTLRMNRSPAMPTATIDAARLRPGMRVAYEDDSGERVVRIVSRTMREEPWLGYGRHAHVEVTDGEPSGPDDYELVAEDDLLGVERCDCCDGPDDLGYYHFSSLRSLRAHLASGREGAVSIDTRGLSCQFDTLADAAAFVARCDEADAEEAAWERLSRDGH